MHYFIKPSHIIFFILTIISCQEREKNSPDEKQQRKDTTITRNEANPYSPVDISPMDMSYFPVDYPKLKMDKTIDQQPVMRIIYSRPHLQGRKMFGQILKYGEPWRLGANEATEIDLYRDVSIQDKKITKGRYILYCIPYENKWTIVLNSNIDTWGLKIDSSKDLYRFEIPVTSTNPSLEYFTMVFEKTDKGATLVMGWEHFLAKLPMEF